MNDQVSTGQPVPYQTLRNRIEQVLASRQDLADQLRSIALETPASSTRKRLLELAQAVQDKVPADRLISEFPDHCWLLTFQSSAATTEALTAMLEQTAFQTSLRNKRLRSIAYPIGLMMASLAVLVFLCSFVVPPFDEMFTEFGLQLPLPTSFLIGISRTITGHPILCFMGFLALLGCVGFVVWCWVSETKLKRKWFPETMNHASARQSLSKVSIQLAELFDDGLPLPESLRIAAESQPHGTFRGVLADLSIQAGLNPDTLSKTRAAMILPPNFLLALLPPGARVPNASMLRDLSVSYRDLSLEHRNVWPVMLSQLAVMGVGLFIAFVVIALFAPMVSLVTSLSS